MFVELIQVQDDELSVDHQVSPYHHTTDNNVHDYRINN